MKKVIIIVASILAAIGALVGIAYYVDKEFCFADDDFLDY